MNQYPAKPLMDQMAGYGRYGDSMLVHMNPVEVAGIASLSPTGKLTTNPVTGQPEAFLPALGPLLGMIGGSLGWSQLGTAALAGVATGAVSGDLNRGIMGFLSSLGGHGLMGGAAETVAEGATELANVGVDAALQTAGDTATDIALDQSLNAMSGTLESGVQNALNLASPDTFTGVAEATGSQIAQQVGATPLDYVAKAQDIGASTTEALASAPQVSASPLGDFDTSIKQFEADKLGKLQNLSLGQAAMISGVPASGIAQLDAYDEQRKQARKLEAESEAKLQEAYADLQGGYAAAQPGIQTGTSKYRGMMSSRTPPPFAPGGMAAGGIVSLAEGGTAGASSIEPTEEEARVLALAKTTPALSAPNQRILEGYYNRVNQVAQQNVKLAGAPEGTLPLQDGVLRIPDGTTNQEAIDSLYAYGLIPKDAYDWFSSHLEATGEKQGQYLASDSFPGIDEYLAQNDFDEARTAQVKQIVSALNKAGSEDGIAEKDLTYLTQGEISEFSSPYNIFGYGGQYNSGYGGIDPVSVQAALRADYNVAAPMDYMAGFEPEFQYFQQDPNNILVPTRAFRPTKAGIRDTGEYFDPILDREAYLEQLRDYYSRLAGFTPAEPTPTTSAPVETPPVTTTPVTTTPFETPVTTTPATQAPVDTGGQITFGGPAATPTPAPAPAPAPVSTETGLPEGFVPYGINPTDRGGNTGPRPWQVWNDSLGVWQVDQNLLDQYKAANPEQFQSNPQMTFGGSEPVVQQAPAPADTAAEAEAQRQRNMDFLQRQAAANALTESQANFLTAKTGQDYTGNVADATAQAAAAAQQQKNMDFLMRQKEAGALTESQAAFLQKKGLMAQGGIVSLQEGGPVPMQRVPLQTSMGEMDVAAGGIADMPSNYSKAPQPSQQEVQMLAKAILGRVLDPDSIVTAFVERYGPEAFRQIREMVLQSVVPNAQTEGMIRGSGSGMDDQVNGMIGAEQPVAVSPGEYIVPADVVSGLGDGSSDAGAAELDQMLSRVRMARGGNAEQAPAINARKTMPA